MLWVTGRPGGHREGLLLTPERIRIFYREWWRPDAAATIVYLHGQGDHSGPFGELGDELYRRGFSVYAYDQRGFGQSREPRGHIDSFDQFVDDAIQVIAFARRRNPGRPIFLLGLSMGGHIALRTGARLGPARQAADGRPVGLGGVIALSPGLKLRKLDYRLAGRVFMNLLFRPKRLLPTVVNIPTTRNQEHLAGAERDEYWVSEYTAKFYWASLRSIQQVLRHGHRGLTMPVLVLQAGEDQLIDGRAAAALVKRLPQGEYRELAGFWHNLVAEPGQDQLAAELSQWIRSHLPAELADAGLTPEPDPEAVSEAALSAELLTAEQAAEAEEEVSAQAWLNWYRQRRGG